MEKNPLLLVFVLAAIGLFAGEAESPASYRFNMDFETPLQRGYAPNMQRHIFINPSQTVVADTSGAKSHSGKGAVALKAGESVVMDIDNLQPGKTYTMTVWVRAEQSGIPAQCRFIWWLNPPAKPRIDGCFFKSLNTEWIKLTRTVKAPDGFTHVHFRLDGGSTEVPVWFDDFSVTEE